MRAIGINKHKHYRFKTQQVGMWKLCKLLKNYLAVNVVVVYSEKVKIDVFYLSKQYPQVIEVILKTLNHFKLDLILIFTDIPINLSKCKYYTYILY